MREDAADAEIEPTAPPLDNYCATLKRDKVKIREKEPLLSKRMIRPQKSGNSRRNIFLRVSPPRNSISIYGSDLNLNLNLSGKHFS